MKQNNIASWEFLKELPTHELDALLQKELHKETVDDELVRLILNVLEERERDYPVEVDAEIEAAAERFAQSLDNHKVGTTKKRTHWIIKVASILLVVGVLLFTIPQAANAETFWEMLVRWTDSVFEFFTPGDSDDKQPEYAFKTDNPGLQDLYDTVVNLGITDPVVPMWVPEGYAIKELSVFEEPSEVTIVLIMKYGERELQLSVCMQKTSSPLNHMKDSQNVEIFEKNGIEHYIFSNNDQLNATWSIRNVECTVVIDCQEDIYRILNSIYTTEVNK